MIFVTNKILSRESNYIMQPKFRNSKHSMREVIIDSILEGLKAWTETNNSFEKWSCFKFNNLELALGMALKFYASAKGLKLKFRKFWGLTLTFVEGTEEELEVNWD